VENFIQNIQQAAWENTPEYKMKLEGNLYLQKIQNLLTEKRKARRKWKQSRAPQDKTILDKLTAELTKELKQLRNESFSIYLSELTNDKSTEYSLWRATKNLKRPILHVPPIKNTNRSWARNNEQKVKIFADHLENIYLPN
jgi:hypothetical protein